MGGSGKPALSYTRSEFNMFSADDSEGFFVQPTVILTKDPRSITMREEIFGPVVTVCETIYLIFPEIWTFSRFMCLRTATMSRLSI